MRLLAWAILLAAGAASAGAEGVWTCVQSAHFSVLTPAGEAHAAAWAVAMEQFYQAMNAGLGRKNPPSPPPVTVVLFRRDRDFAPYRPLEHGRPARLGGFFIRADDINVIALSLDGENAELQRTIQHETVHWYFSTRGRPLPPWLEEGLAEAYSTFHRADATHGVFGEPIPAHLRLLRRQGLVPLEQLVATKRGAIEYNETLRTGIFYAESWLFAHFLIFGGDSEPGQNLGRYEAALDRGMDPAEAFRRCLGSGGPDLMAKLQNYLNNQNFRHAVVPIDGGEIARSLHSRPARPGEVELALGSILLATRSEAEAEAHLQRAIELLPGEPRPWECLGQLDLVYSHPEAAARAYAQAADFGSTNYRAFYNFALARLGYRPETLEEVPMAIASDVRPSLDALERALALQPDFVAGYRIFGWLMGSSRGARPEDRALLERGLTLAPLDLLIASGLGAAEIKTGREETGRLRLQRLIAAFPGDPSAYARAILQADDLDRFYRHLDALFAGGAYGEVKLAIAQFEATDPERAAAEWDRLQALKQRADRR